MHLQEKDLFDLNKTLGDYLLFSDTSSKKDMQIREVLSHQANYTLGYLLQANLKEDGQLRDTLYSKEQSEKYSIQVAEGIYLHHEYTDSIFQQVVNSKLLDEKEYKYSDLGITYCILLWKIYVDRS